MRRLYVILGISVGLVVFGIVLVFASMPTQGARRTFNRYSDPQVGSIFVVGRYNGFGDGWNVAFFHVDNQRKWLGFYLGHESLSLEWRNIHIRRESDVVVLEKNRERLAEYSLINGTFNNLLQEKKYSREEGQVDKRRGPAWWGLME